MSLKNEVSSCQEIYYDGDTQVILNQLVSQFNTQFLFKIDTPPQGAVFPLDIATTFFNNLSPDVRELWISEGVQLPPMSPTKTNQQENQCETKV